MAHVQRRQTRCECTLPFSLHLTVLILGVIGFVLSILVAVAVFISDDRYRRNARAEKYSAVWLLLTTLVVCVSGLQGLLVRAGSCCSNCHTILAVLGLANLGVIGVSSLLVGNVFWIIYIVLVFVFELWVTVLETCCKAPVREGGMELPVARPEQQPVVAMPASVQHVVGIPVPPQPYKLDPRTDAAGSATSHPGFEARVY